MVSNGVRRTHEWWVDGCLPHELFVPLRVERASDGGGPRADDARGDDVKLTIAVRLACK